MKLSLIIANNTNSATRGVIEQIAPFLDDESEHIIIVPDRYSFAVEKMVFDVLNISSTFNIRVMGISRFAKLIFKECGLENTYITSRQQSLLTETAIEIVKNDFKFFQNAKNDEMFSDEMSKLIAQFESSEISAEAITKAMQGDGFLSRKMQDIAMVFEQYDILRGDRLDASKLIEKLIDIGNISPTIKNSHFYFAGFLAHTAQGLSLIETLLRFSKSVCVGVVCANENQKNQYIYEKEQKDKLTAIAKNIGATIETYKVTNEDGLSENLICSIFSTSTLKLEGSQICEYGASSVTDEVEYIAKQIVYLAKNYGERYKQSAVAVSSLEKYKELIERVFSQNNIAFYIDADHSLGEVAVVKHLAILINAITENFSRESVQAVIEADKTLSAEEKSLLVNNIFVFEREGETFEKELPFDYENKKQTESLFNNILKPILIAKNEIDNAKTVSGYCQIVKQLIEDTSLCEEASRDETILQNIGAVEMYEISKQWNAKLDSIFQDFVTFLPEFEMSFDDFVKLFSNAIQSTKITAVPVSADCVFVGEVSSSYFEKVDNLFLIGANQSLFPTIGQDCGLIVDKEIESLKRHFSVEPSMAVVNFRNRLRAIDLFSNVKKRLFVSYQTKSTDGNKDFKSNILLQIEKHFQNIKNANYLEQISSLGATDLVLDGSDKTGNLLFQCATVDFAKKMLVKELANSLDTATNCSGTIYKALKTAKIEIPIDAEPTKFCVSKKNLSTGRKMSASRIEKFFACPFMSFANYVLGVKTPEKRTPNPRLVGSFIHEFAEVFTNNCKCGLKKMSKENLDAIKEQTFENLAQKTDYAPMFLCQNSKAFRMQIKKQCFLFVEKLIMQQSLSAYTITKTEYRVGGNEDNFVGFVDRIDEKDNAFLIIDYKTGADKASLKDIFVGKKVQLFLYANAVKSVLNKTCDGVFYFPIKSASSKNKDSVLLDGFMINDLNVAKSIDATLNKAETKKSVITGAKLLASGKGFAKSNLLLSREEFEKVSGYVSALCKNARNEIENGEIKPSPLQIDGKTTCDFCDYKAMCQFSDDKTILRKVSGKIQVEHFLEVESE